MGWGKERKNNIFKGAKELCPKVLQKPGDDAPKLLMAIAK